MSKVALVTGITGQDGAYLAQHLLKQNYKVVGASRRISVANKSRLAELGIEKDIEFVDFDLFEISNMMSLLARYKPDEIYNLAAQSFVGASFNLPIYTSDANALGVGRFLEAVRIICPSARYYQASTSEMFGKVQSVPQVETTYFYPRSPYGVAKLFGHWMTVNYRESWNMYACSGILFNHESPLRGQEFVTRKISLGLAKVKAGQQDLVELGNLDAKRDWGFAGDYVVGMWQMLQQKTAEDYVLATNKTHSVREFVQIAGEVAGFDFEFKGSGKDEVGIDKKSGRVVVKVNSNFFRPAEVDLLIGNPQKAEEKLDWKRNTDFKSLVRMMTEADMRRVSANAILV